VYIAIYGRTFVQLLLYAQQLILYHINADIKSMLYVEGISHIPVTVHIVFVYTVCVSVQACGEVCPTTLLWEDIVMTDVGDLFFFYYYYYYYLASEHDVTEH